MHAHKAPQENTCVEQQETICANFNTKRKYNKWEHRGHIQCAYIPRAHTHMWQCTVNCWKLHVSLCSLYHSGPVVLNLSPSSGHNVWLPWMLINPQFFSDIQKETHFQIQIYKITCATVPRELTNWMINNKVLEVLYSLSHSLSSVGCCLVCNTLLSFPLTESDAPQATLLRDTPLKALNLLGVFVVLLHCVTFLWQGLKRLKLLQRIGGQLLMSVNHCCLIG